MILDVDVGNTRVKWRFAGESSAKGFVYRRDIFQADLGLNRTAPTGAIERVRVSSVANAQFNRDFTEYCQRRFGVVAEYAQVESELGGVKAGYDNYSQLGVDRWLALAAAYRKVRDALVVISAGSAVTVDWVDPSGLHRGGVILPGIHLIVGSLFGGTDRVKLDSVAMPAVWQPGKSTVTCVENGMSAMYQGLLSNVVDMTVRLGFPTSTAMLFCGGDAMVFEKLGHAAGMGNTCIDAELVLDGLAIALP